NDFRVPAFISHLGKLFLFMSKLAADLIKASRGTEGAGSQRGKMCVCLEKGGSTLILLWRDQAVGQFIMQIFLKHVAFINDHPDNEDEHDCVTYVIYKGSGEQTFKASNQSAERIMEGVGNDSNRIACGHR